MLWHALFDALAWSASVLTAWWVRRRWLAAPSEVRSLAYLAALVAGVAVGAYGLGTLNRWLAGTPQVGRSILGALLGGILGVEGYKAAAGLRVTTGPVWALPCAVGIAIGRIGCQLSGLPDATYGVPSAVPWAIALQDGVPRHPVALYESATMAALATALAWGLAHQRPWALRRGFALLCIVYGSQRFGWEALKPEPALLGSLSLMQLASLTLAAVGVVLWRDAGVSGRGNGHPYDTDAGAIRRARADLHGPYEHGGVPARLWQSIWRRTDMNRDCVPNRR